MFEVAGRLVASYRKLEPAFRSRLKRWALVSGALGVALGATIAIAPRPRLVWNASASMPIGLYDVEVDEEPALGVIVIARLPDEWQEMAAARGYIPVGVPLVKIVAAGTGDRVCAAGPDISINGQKVTRRLATDVRGRALPWWEGCRLLGQRDVFLLTANPASFDGRYFGPTTQGEILGVARPLWLL